MIMDVKGRKLIKGKIHPIKGHKSTEASTGIVLLFFNLGASWGGWLTSHLRPLYPQERYPVPTVQEACWSPGPVWTKISPPPGFDPLTVQPVASRYTD